MSGLYIHIPFCKQICYYCDFHFSLSLKYKTEMINAMLKELCLTKNYLGSNSIDTIYFGGGTPSVLSYDEIMLFFDAIGKYYSIDGCSEISFEANPDDLSLEYLKQLKHTPVNRLSIGIQSFNDADLQLMNRRHTGNEAKECLDRVFDLGYSNVTADLMYALPNGSISELDRNLSILTDYPITHISAYNLTIEDGTAFGKFKRQKRIAEVPDIEAINQADYVRNYLADKGFEQYEISNFAKNAMYSQHNTAYWKSEKYLGIGPSAHSYDGVSRQWNISHNRKFIEAISNGLPFFEKEELSEQDRYNEYLFTNLRTKWGVSLKELQTTFSDKYYEHLYGSIQEYISKNQLVINNQYVQLTDKGKAIADGIASDLFFVEE